MIARRVVSIALALGAGIVACGTGESVVEITGGHLFEPSLLTVEAGAAVVFTNVSGEAHTVTAYGDSIPSGAAYFASSGSESEEGARADLAAGLLTQGETFRVVFDVSGTYRYFCIPHEGDGMTGTVVVGP